MPGIVHGTPQALFHFILLKTPWVFNAEFLSHFKDKEIEAKNSVRSHTAGKNEGKFGLTHKPTLPGTVLPAGETAVNKQTFMSWGSSHACG